MTSLGCIVLRDELSPMCTRRLGITFLNICHLRVLPPSYTQVVLYVRLSWFVQYRILHLMLLLVTESSSILLLQAVHSGAHTFQRYTGAYLPLHWLTFAVKTQFILTCFQSLRNHVSFACSCTYQLQSPDNAQGFRHNCVRRLVKMIKQSTDFIELNKNYGLNCKEHLMMGRFLEICLCSPFVVSMVFWHKFHLSS